MTVPRGYPVVGYDSVNKIVHVTGGLTQKSTEYLDLKTMKWHQASSIALPDLRKYANGDISNDGVNLLIAGGAYNNLESLETTPSDSVLISYNTSVNNGGLNDIHEALSATTSTLTFSTPDYKSYTHATTGKIVPVYAQDLGLTGPFAYDPHIGVGVTAIDGILAVGLNAYQNYTKITLNSGNALDFPNEPGYLVFEFGRKDTVYPVKYYGRLSSSELAIDGNFTFPVKLEIGSTVTLLHSKAAFVPTNPEDVGSFYLTNSPAGRVAAEQAIKDSFAAGLKLNIDIVYPGDRGLGNEGYPAENNYKLSDKVRVWAGNDIDGEIAAARNGE
jgi:hypothetical protein